MVERSMPTINLQSHFSSISCQSSILMTANLPSCCTHLVEEHFWSVHLYTITVPLEIWLVRNSMYNHFHTCRVNNDSYM